MIHKLINCITNGSDGRLNWKQDEFNELTILLKCDKIASSDVLICFQRKNNLDMQHKFHESLSQRQPLCYEVDTGLSMAQHFFQLLISRNFMCMAFWGFSFRWNQFADAIVNLFIFLLYSRNRDKKRCWKRWAFCMWQRQIGNVRAKVTRKSQLDEREKY